VVFFGKRFEGGLIGKDLCLGQFELGLEGRDFGVLSLGFRFGGETVVFFSELVIGSAELVSALCEVGVVINAELFELSKSWEIRKELPTVVREGVLVVLKRGTPIVDRGEVIDVV
jgi:hypothetical protein